MDGLKMKYFVLKPAGDDAYAKASRAAMNRYATDANGQWVEAATAIEWEHRARVAERALEQIDALLSAEITERFGGHPSKSEAEIGRNSSVYSLLVVPRNMARAARQLEEPQSAPDQRETSQERG